MFAKLFSSPRETPILVGFGKGLCIGVFNSQEILY